MMNYSNTPKWIIWVSIILLGLMGIAQLYRSISSLGNEQLVISFVSLIITLAIIYFVTYIPIKIMYEEVR